MCVFAYLCVYAHCVYVSSRNFHFRRSPLIISVSLKRLRDHYSFIRQHILRIQKEINERPTNLLKWLLDLIARMNLLRNLQYVHSGGDCKHAPGGEEWVGVPITSFSADIRDVNYPDLSTFLSSELVISFYRRLISWLQKKIKGLSVSLKENDQNPYKVQICTENPFQEEKR